MAVHCSLELKKIKNFIQPEIKIILLFSHRASFFSHCHLSEALSQNSLLKLTLLTSLSQAHSFTTADLTHPQRCRHRSSISPTYQPSQAANQIHFSSADQTHLPQTHFSSTNQTHDDTILLTKAQLYDW